MSGLPEQPRIFCSCCKKEIRQDGFTYTYAVHMPADRRLCNRCEKELHRPSKKPR